MVYFNRIFFEDIRNCVRLALYFTLTRDRNRFRRQFRRKCGGQFTRPFRRKFPSGAAFFRRFPGYAVPGKPRITVCLIVPCCQIFCRSQSNRALKSPSSISRSNVLRCWTTGFGCRRFHWKKAVRSLQGFPAKNCSPEKSFLPGCCFPTRFPHHFPTRCCSRRNFLSIYPSCRLTFH